MPKRAVFDEMGGRFSLNNDGDLIRTESYEGDRTLVEYKELEDFVAWLTDELDTFQTAQREATAAKAKL